MIGGGNVAMDAARMAGRCSQGRVSLFCLESRDGMPASREEILEASEENISIHNGWGPKEILTENGRAVAVVFEEMYPCL